MSSPPAKSMSAVHEAVNCFITSAPAQRTTDSEGTSSSWKTSPFAIVAPAAIIASISKIASIVLTGCPTTVGTAKTSAPTPAVAFAVKSKVAIVLSSLNLRYI